jgi:hypothetical protein
MKQARHGARGANGLCEVRIVQHDRHAARDVEHADLHRYRRVRHRRHGQELAQQAIELATREQARARCWIPEVVAPQARQAIGELPRLEPCGPRTADERTRAGARDELRPQPTTGERAQHPGVGEEAEEPARHRERERLGAEPVAEPFSHGTRDSRR